MTPSSCIVCGDRPAPAATTARGLSFVRSPGCGLEWLSPFPDERRLAEIYADSYLDRWGIDGPASLARVRAMKEATYRGFLAEVQKHKRSGNLLDLGCALGFLLAVARERGFDAWGVDLNADAIEKARAEFGGRVAAESLETAFAGQSFDVVTMIDVLEHIPEPRALLRTVASRLAPDGVLAMVLPNAASMTRAVLRSRWPHYVEEHLWCWTPRSLRTFLEAEGWRVLRVKTGVTKTFTAPYLLSYSKTLGSWIPPGLRLLGSIRFPASTGEMLCIATPSSRGV